MPSLRPPLVSLFLAAAVIAQASPPPIEPPRLVVMISVDQMSSDVVEAVRPHLPVDGGGFAGLERIGVEFSESAYRHACTVTGPGHATLGTGATPSAHGIVGNDWYDLAAGKSRYCGYDPGAVGIGSLTAIKNRGPAMLVAPTLGDTMKQAFGAQSKVVSLSWKDRSAILMGGKSADVVAWADRRAGVFTSSSRWCEALPQWLTLFNLSRPIDRLFGATWERTAPASAYEGLTDLRKFEKPGALGSRTLPLALTGGLKAPGPKFFDAVYGSPFGNEVLFDLARAAITAEGLGRDATPDLLCLGFSANDAIGHRCGPWSVEVRDVTLRTDRLLREFVAMLDARVGPGRWSMIVSADHGITPAPEALKSAGKSAGRGQLMLGAGMVANAALVEKLGVPQVPPAPPIPLARWVRHFDGQGLFLDRDALAKVKDKITLEEACAVAAQAVVAAPGVEVGWSVSEIRKGARGPHVESIRASVFEGRSPDVFVVFQPGWISGGNAATHGSPHPTDQRVPLWFVPPSGARKHWKLGRCDAPTGPGLGVVLLSEVLGIKAPAKADQRVPVSARN